jgi:hypothetical protein
VKEPNKRGLPSAFTNRNSKVAYASMSEQGHTFNMPQVIAALEEAFPGYTVTNIQAEPQNNRDVARLTK